MQNYPWNQMQQPGTTAPTSQPYQAQQAPMGPPHQGAVDPSMQHQQMYDLCQQYMHHLVQFQTSDGQTVDGIIDGIDRDGVSMLVPDGDDDQAQTTHSELRYGYPGYGGYGGYPGYGYGYPRRFRRFRRRRFPFYLLSSLLFPYFY
ncbi:hypothetical protein [Halalkalibacter alkalisediminis]|uniref:Uncharacterized protein n=1 Tax=Halalkalibacter alkalisediminis TaxID=935616 RepID=A0ABV6NH56_9BACI|nr:hypothetical protein [Halalkalibacter alkalisediminis]